MNIDRFIIPLDRALRTLFATAHSSRPIPVATSRGVAGRDRTSAGRLLMRVNHTGEVCAQALYEGQMLVARDPRVLPARERRTKRNIWPGPGG